MGRQMLGPHPRLPESELPGVERSSLCLTRLLPSPSCEHRRFMCEMVTAGDGHTVIVGPSFMV